MREQVDPQVELEGRSNMPVIDIWNDRKDHLFRLNGAELNVRESRSIKMADIQCRHPDGVDSEHDAARVARLELAGVSFIHMFYSSLTFSGVLMAGQWYDTDQSFEPGTKFPDDAYLPDDEIRWCESDYHVPEDEWGKHRIMPYSPPDRTWTPQAVEITVSYNRFLT